MFVYLSKKIAIPNGVHLRCASWNATKRLRGKDLPLTLALCEWSPDGRFVLFGTTSGRVLVYDSGGDFIAETRVVHAHA